MRHSSSSSSSGKEGTTLVCERPMPKTRATRLGLLVDLQTEPSIVGNPNKGNAAYIRPSTITQLD